MLVATVLTVYGIETSWCFERTVLCSCKLQQCLPFTVLKPFLEQKPTFTTFYHVATVLTVYGIETSETSISFVGILNGCNSAYRLRYWNFTISLKEPILLLTGCNSAYRLRYWNAILERKCLLVHPVATVLTVYGIETLFLNEQAPTTDMVATVLTVYGIETTYMSIPILSAILSCNSAYRLRYWNPYQYGMDY